MPTGKNLKQFVTQHCRLPDRPRTDDSRFSVLRPRRSSCVTSTFSTPSAPRTSASISIWTGAIGSSSSWAARSKRHWSCLRLSSPHRRFTYPNSANDSGVKRCRSGCGPSRKTLSGSLSIGLLCYPQCTRARVPTAQFHHNDKSAGVIQDGRSRRINLSGDCRSSNVLRSSYRISMSLCAI
jgi:hypothetical protein